MSIGHKEPRLSLCAERGFYLLLTNKHMLAMILAMWVRSIIQTGIVIPQGPPFPLAPQTKAKKLSSSSLALTELSTPVIIPSKRTFIVANAERAIADVWKEVMDEWRANEQEQNPFERLHYIPVSVDMLAKLFSCIDLNDLPSVSTDESDD